MIIALTMTFWDGYRGRMRFRVPELFLGAFLSVAIFAIGILFWESYQPNLSKKNRTQHAEITTQYENTKLPLPLDGSDSGQHREEQEIKSEFWSAKLSDWALVAFTGLLVLFTYRLWKSTEKLWSAGKDQIELAREEFISSHRPRLRIRSIDRATSSPTDYIGVKFAVVNVGDTEARLIGSRVAVDFFQEKPPIDFNGMDVVEPRRFLPGASDSYVVTSQRKWLILQSEYNATRYLFVHGQIVYRSDIGTTYATSFCRVWNIAANRFKRTDDPDYEYED